MTPLLEDEATLWSASLDHDDRAFGALFDLHRDRVFRHVLRLVEHRGEAEDVTAAAFFDLWRRRADVRVVEGSVLPWLLVTAGNLARNHGRKARRYQQVLRTLPRDPGSYDVTAVVEEQDDLDRRAAAVRHAFARLKPIDAQLLDLTTRAELPVQDAAAVLGISAGAARVRLHRARNRLRDLLPADLDPSYPNEAR